MAPASGGRRDGPVTLDAVREASPTRILPYDKTGDVHYDVISAFIKSMRGSDPDAAVYWLARMIHGGEDPKFIARRMLIFASEDVGNADPQALLVAHAAFKAAESIGWPECRINLAQAAVYLALAPKSNAAYTAVDAALAEVRNGPGARRARTTCATGTGPAPTRTARTGTRTTTRTALSSSATCPTVSSAARSSRRRRADGRPSGRRGSRSRARRHGRAAATSPPSGRRRPLTCERARSRQGCASATLTES